MLEHHHLPDSLPYVSLADGMPFLNGHWLSDLTIGWVSSLGPEWVSAFGAIATTIALIMWCRIFFLLSKRLRFAMATTAALTIYWSFGFGALRSQMLAALILPLALLLVNPAIEKAPAARNREADSWRFGAFFVLFVLWANLDLSHLIGVMLTVAFAIGIAIDRWIDGHRWKDLTNDIQLRRWTLFAELAVAATFLNPYGSAFWSGLFRMDRQGPIWRHTGGTYGLQLASTSGALFGVLLAGLVLLWLRQKPVSYTHLTLPTTPYV